MIRALPTENLFVGHALDARDWAALHASGIRAVIDVAINEAPAVLPRELIYVRVPLNDGGGNAPESLRLVVETTERLLRAGTRTLVACSAGMSRAPSIAAATWARLSGLDPDICLHRVVAGAPNDISPLFWADLKAALR